MEERTIKYCVLATPGEDITFKVIFIERSAVLLPSPSSAHNSKSCEADYFDLPKHTLIAVVL
jgi:hypothetical protein